MTRALRGQLCSVSSVRARMRRIATAWFGNIAPRRQNALSRGAPVPEGWSRASGGDGLWEVEAGQDVLACAARHLAQLGQFFTQNAGGNVSPRLWRSARSSQSTVTTAVGCLLQRSEGRSLAKGAPLRREGLLQLWRSQFDHLVLAASLQHGAPGFPCRPAPTGTCARAQAGFVRRLRADSPSGPGAKACHARSGFRRARHSDRGRCLPGRRN